MTLSLSVNLQNGINADKQRALLSQRREKLASKLKQALARTQMPNYAEKVPNRVRQETENKVSTEETGQLYFTKTVNIIFHPN